MPRHQINMKNCVTCQFWQGARKPSELKGWVEYGRDSDQGECALGKWARQTLKAMFSCRDWEKWGAVR